MQIQNKKHIEDIEDRNDKLLKFKNSSANVQHTLNSLKDKLEAAKKRAGDIKREMETKQASLIKNEADIASTAEAIRKANIMRRK